MMHGMAVMTTRAVLVWTALLSTIGKQIHTVEALTPERRYACWGSFGPPVVSAQCPRNTAIQVLRAGLKVQKHGGLCAYNDNDCGCEYGQTGCQIPDVGRLCMGRPACRLDVTQQYISTKHCRGFSDYMYIEFNCVPVEHNSVVSEICSAVNAESQSGFLRSPAWPEAARAERECDCTLTTDDISTIQLTVLDIQTRDYKCDHDKLLVAYDGRTDKYCGELPDTNKRIASQSAVVSVKYSTDGQGQGGSFWLKYEAEPKAEVKLTCTFTEIATTPKTTPVITEKTTEVKKMMEIRRPSTKVHRPTAPTTEPTKQLNHKDKEKSAKPKHKPPWWWKFVKSTNSTKPVRKATKPPTTPPVLVDASKTLLSSNPKGRPQVAPAATTTTTTTTDRHHHQHPKFVQANKGKSPITSTGINNKLPLPQAVRSFVDKSGQRWSHLPKSLLNKLQFPLPMIRALERELVAAPDGESSNQPYLRILPDLRPTQPASHAPSHKSDIDTPSSRSHATRRRYKSPPVTPLQRDIKPSDVQSQSAARYHMQSQAKQPPASYGAKPRYSELMDVDFKLPKSNPTTPKPRLTSPPRETVHSVHHYTPAVKNELLRERLPSGEQRNAKHSSTSRTKALVVHRTTMSKPPTTIVQPTTAKSSAYPPVTDQPKILTKFDPSKEPPPPQTTMIGSPAHSNDKVVNGKENAGVPRRGKGLHYKGYNKPMSKEASVNAQPAWAEPLELPPEESQVNPYPKVRSKSFNAGPKLGWGRRRYRLKGGVNRERAIKRAGSRERYNPGGGERGTGSKERLKVKKKYKPKRIWRERADKSRVSVIRPEAKMYIPLRRSQRKRLKKVHEDVEYDEEVLEEPSTMAPSVDDVVAVTTIQPTQPPTTQGVVLKDSVHSSDIVVVKDLAGKIETVSDFYTALDEEDWMQWPAFEMVKNAQEQENNRSNNASKAVLEAATTLSPPVTTPKAPKPTQPQLKRHVAKQAPRLPPTRRPYQKPARKPSHTMQTARPALFAKAPSIDRSIVRLPPKKSTKVSSVSYKTKTKTRRREPPKSVTPAYVPSKSESLTRPRNNAVTIIAVASVGSVLIVVVLGIVIRFVVNRKRERYHGQPVSKSKRSKAQVTPDNHHYPGQKIPRPRMI